MNSLKVSHSIFTTDCDLCIFWMRSRIQDSDLGQGCRFLQLISNSRSRPIPRCVYKLGYATHVTRNVQKHEILSLSLTLRLYRMTFGNETATCFWRFRSCAVCLSVSSLGNYDLDAATRIMTLPPTFVREISNARHSRIEYCLKMPRETLHCYRQPYR